MSRVHVVVEGQTERRFVTDFLSPALAASGVYVYPRLLGIVGHKGGRVTADRVRKDVSLLLQQEAGTYCTTLFDYYGLGTGLRPRTTGQPGLERAVAAEQLLTDCVTKQLAGRGVERRFFPYVQLHEFEALPFSDPVAFANGISRPDLTSELMAIRRAFATPEDINDSPVTAPSKRILALYPGYRKVLFGRDAAVSVGLPAMRRECPRFRAWLERLESLGQSARP